MLRNLPKVSYSGYQVFRFLCSKSQPLCSCMWVMLSQRGEACCLLSCPRTFPQCCASFLCCQPRVDHDACIQRVCVAHADLRYHCICRALQVVANQGSVAHTEERMWFQQILVKIGKSVHSCPQKQGDTFPVVFTFRVRRRGDFFSFYLFWHIIDIFFGRWQVGCWELGW